MLVVCNKVKEPLAIILQGALALRDYCRYAIYTILNYELVIRPHPLLELSCVTRLLPLRDTYNIEL